ncbi:hypothetical protein F5J12DRAFT_785762 [Pisolithus orientalis]|uniref:uncharacterized protein n=1 Tax=Pisolithus orientalis TaxID=936130 RepID=UPI0022240AF8|nr:uncharacterized protein F5J12DRAFT_785762 [Pisolithus orientalis]KAI5994568.1 hypothetical protein F5J12DRAFT_785762 [Pisolithus orientalis]
MLLLTKTILFYWDFLDVQSHSAKGNIAGFGKVKDWAEKLSSSKAICSPRVSASSTSHSCASSLSNVTSFGVKGSTRSTHSSATQPPPTPASVSSRVVPVSYPGEDSELAEIGNYTQESISKGSNASTRVSIEVIDNIHSPSISPPPPSQPCIIAKTAVSAKPVKSELSMYYDRLSSDDEVIEVDQVSTPPRGSLKPASGLTGDLQDAMQIIWDEVYCGKVEHYIAPRGPVFHVQEDFSAAMFHLEMKISTTEVCWALTLAAHGNLQLKKLMSGSKPQKCAVLLKGDSGVTWEVIIPDGKPYGFNFQMWGEMMRKLLQPIMVLSNVNFSTIVEETQCYVKVSAKGKERSTRSSGFNEDDDDNFQNLFKFQ